jgi:hypothetical protein
MVVSTGSGTGSGWVSHHQRQQARRVPHRKDAPMIQAPISPGFVPLPFNRFEFAMLFLSFILLVVLALPQRWQRHILRALFCVKVQRVERR